MPLGGTPFRGLEDPNTDVSGGQQGAALEGLPKRGTLEPKGRPQGGSSPTNPRESADLRGGGREPQPRNVVEGAWRVATWSGSLPHLPDTGFLARSSQ